MDCPSDGSWVQRPVDPTATYAAAFDAWNALVELTAGASTVQENEYDGARRRTVRKDYSAGTLDETRHFYYAAAWQSIEERLNNSSDTERQFAWGLRYIDDLVARDRDTNADGTLDERLYALQDANWNVIAIADTAGVVEERYAYEAYGQPKVLTAAFAGRSSSSSTWEILFTGYRCDIRTALCHARNRFYHPLMGSWTVRDLLGYSDGMHLYEYALGNPLRWTDPIGLRKWTVKKCSTGKILILTSYTACTRVQLDNEECTATIQDTELTGVTKLPPNTARVVSYISEIEKETKTNEQGCRYTRLFIKLTQTQEHYIDIGINIGSVGTGEATELSKTVTHAFYLECTNNCECEDH